MLMDKNYYQISKMMRSGALKGEIKMMSIMKIIVKVMSKWDMSKN